MAYIRRRQLVIALALLGLVLADLLTDVALLWLIEERWLTRQWLEQFAYGLVVAPVMLVGLWFGLGDGRWYVRLIVAIALTMCVAISMGLAEELSPIARRPGNPNPWGMITFILIPMMLAAALPAFVLRRTRGWQLTWCDVVIQSPTRQFEIGDTLLWMMLIGGTLAAIRFIKEEFEMDFFDMSVMTATAAAATLAAMLAAFTEKKRLRAFLVLIAMVLAIGAMCAIPYAWRNIDTMRASNTPPTTWTRFIYTAFFHIKEREAFAIAAAFSALANCAVLRALGCRLVRPGQQEIGH